MSKVNNYNLFLKKLDEKNRRPVEEKKPGAGTGTGTGAGTSVLEEELEMLKRFMKQIEANFTLFQHDSSMFTGKTTYDEMHLEKKKPHSHAAERKTEAVAAERKTEAVATEKTRTKVHIHKEIHHIRDLLSLIEDHPVNDETEYNINIALLHQIKEPLTSLNDMVGMNDIKINVIHQILYFMQNLHKNSENQQVGDFMHTIIYGPPGTGKTELAKIIGQIYSKMGILKRGIFKKVTRSDLIAGYLGQTAAKTRDVINECLGGVLFIDEAYALGNSEKKDSFSKECIDTLCEALSDHKEDLMVIVAGYEKELNECFLAYNPGLDSRFQWRFHTEKYNPRELHEIFLKKVAMIGWHVSEKTIQADWFEKKRDYFVFYGRDIEILLSKVKISHGKRVFCRPVEEKKIITMEDLEKGFAMFLQNEEVKKRRETALMKEHIASLYV